MKQIEINSEAWQSLIADIADNYSNGELIPHEWLKQKFGIGRIELDDYENTDEFIKALQCQQFAYMQLVDTLRWQLLESERYYIRNIRGDGYQIVQPQDQTKFGFDGFVDSVKKAIREANLIMNNVRSVTSEQRSKDNELRAKCSIIKQMLLNVRK